MDKNQSIPTPHIKAQKDEIAKVVIMPGDPLRAKFIAEKFLTDIKEVNSVRNMLMYTGKYQGHEITVAGSGMGTPSIGIYSYELYKFYDVDCIIRIGTAGSYQKDINVYDVINVKSAYSESSFARVAAGNLDSTAADLVRQDKIASSDKIYQIIAATAKTIDKNETDDSKKINLKTGLIHTSDVFYQFNNENKLINPATTNEKLKNCLCVEMESFALFCNATLLNKNAACILTISDSLVTGEAISADKRQTTLIKMMSLALESAVAWLKNK